MPHHHTSTITPSSSLATVTSSVAGASGAYDAAAVLPLKGTTVTAFEVASETGVAVIDHKTLSLHGKPIEIDGVKISIGREGIEDKTTTAKYQPLEVKSVSTYLICPYVRHHVVRHC